MFRIHQIYKSYATKKILNGVDLLIEQGAIQSLLGANGAGKSTLIHCISFIIPFESGEVWIDGEQITHKSYQYRSKVGYVFEKPIYIDKFSANEYLHFVAEMYKIPKTERKLRVDELLDFMELPTDNKKYIESYSKGMKNKVSLAAALIHQPKYLILDEPFDGMDFMSVQKVCKLFRNMVSKGISILVTSHQYDVIAAVADKFALLKDGEIKFNLSMAELEEKAKIDFANEKNPVKAFLEVNMSSNSSTNNLSWVN